MSKFRTIEISDPRFEADRLRHITVKSNNLKGRGNISVYIPAGKDYTDLPITILLHGVYGSHWSWSHKGGIHHKMNEWIAHGKLDPMIVAMPSDGLWGDGSGYLPHEYVNFEKWIVEDVIDAVVEIIPEASDHSQLFLAGLSMGGFGALRIGAKSGPKFTAIAGLSSITKVEQIADFVEEDWSSKFLSSSEGNSVIATILKHRKHLPNIYFNCGLSDSLLSENRILHQQLEHHGIHHVYVEAAGGHDWSFWEATIFETMLFFDDLMRPR